MEKIKMPSSESLKKAQEEFKNIYKKPFTDDLIKIISEVGKDEDALEDEDTNRKVAKGVDDNSTQLGL